MTDAEAKDRILQAAVDLLNEEDDPGRITVRRIAERAGVGIGAINYYFQSKDNLLNEAVAEIMREEAVQWFQPEALAEADPVARLRMLFKQTARIGARYPMLTGILLEHVLQQGDFGVPQMIMPILREIYGTSKAEIELRIMALQIAVPMQVAFLRHEAFRAYAGIDVYDEEQRNRAIDLLVDNIVTRQEEVK